WLRENLGDHTFEDAVVIDHENVDDRFALLDLLPQPRGRRLRRVKRHRAGNADGDAGQACQHGVPSKSQERAAHRHHLTNSPIEWRETTAISRMLPVPGFRAKARSLAARSYFGWNQLTPSFFCRLDDEVVYWNTSRLSG